MPRLSEGDTRYLMNHSSFPALSYMTSLGIYFHAFKLHVALSKLHTSQTRLMC